MTTPTSKRMQQLTSQTPHFQFGSLIHPNSRQKVPLRRAESFSNHYHYSTNITRYLKLLLKRLIFFFLHISAESFFKTGYSGCLSHDVFGVSFLCPPQEICGGPGEPEGLRAKDDLGCCGWRRKRGQICIRFLNYAFQDISV